jgi:heptosyltransferase-3
LKNLNILFYWGKVYGYYLSLYVKVLLLRIRFPKKVFLCIAMDGDLGDMVASEPILSRLNQKFKYTHITWITSKKYFSVYGNHPLVDLLVNQKYTLLSYLLQKSNPFHHYFNLHLSGFRRDKMTGISIINTKADELGIDLFNYYQKHNLLEIALKLCDLALEDAQPKIYLDGIPYKSPFEKSYWVIHCKSNAGLRDWTDDHWRNLIAKIIATWNVKIIEIGRVNPLDFAHENFISLVGKTSLSETMKIMKGASFFLGLDSGPTHIANAFMLPGLVLKGEFLNFKTYVSYSGMYQSSPKVKVLFNGSGNAKGLPFDIVWSELCSLMKQFD